MKSTECFLFFVFESKRLGFGSVNRNGSIFSVFIYSHSFPPFLFSHLHSLEEKKFERLREWVWGRENCLKCMERKGIDSAPSPKDFLNNIFCLCTWTTFTSHKENVFFIYILRLNVYIYICTYKREKQWLKINLFPETQLKKNSFKMQESNLQMFYFHFLETVFQTLFSSFKYRYLFKILFMFVILIKSIFFRNWNVALFSDRCLSLFSIKLRRYVTLK